MPVEAIARGARSDKTTTMVALARTNDIDEMFELLRANKQISDARASFQLEHTIAYLVPAQWMIPEQFFTIWSRNVSMLG